MRLNRLNQDGYEKPIMLVDDVGLGLDVKRRGKFIQKLTELGQVFLTTTDEDLLAGICPTQRKSHQI